MTLNVSQKISSITPKNTGSAVYLPVSTLSHATLRLCSRLSWHFTTASAVMPSMNVYRMSARDALRSRPFSVSICTMQCSSSSRSF